MSAVGRIEAHCGGMYWMLRLDATNCNQDGNQAARGAVAEPGKRAVQVEWGGWDSNPGPADYESAALTG